MPRSLQPARARPEQFDTAAQVGSRLRGEIRSLLDSLPADRRKASQLVRWLKLQPALVYRVVAGGKHAGDPAGVLLTVPGVEGFRIFLAAIARRGADPGRVRSLGAAVDAYARLIDRLGGSQAQLRAAISSAAPDRSGDAADDDPPPSVPAAAASVAMARAFGRGAISTIAVQLYLPSPDDPGFVEAWTVSGKVGLSGKHSRTPVRFTTSVVQGDEQSRAVEHVSGLLEGFCTPGLRRSNAEPIGASRVEIVEAPEDGSAFDVFSVPRRTPRVAELPPTSNDGVINSGLVLSVPSRWLVYDVYLHRSLAERSVPELGVFAPSPSGPLVGHPSRRWYDRLNDSPGLLLLGRGDDAAHTPAYARHAELTAFLFRHAGQNPASFVGHRCAIPDPYWGASYVMTFDFGRPETGTG